MILNPTISKDIMQLTSTYTSSSTTSYAKTTSSRRYLNVNSLLTDKISDATYGNLIYFQNMLKGPVLISLITLNYRYVFY